VSAEQLVADLRLLAEVVDAGQPVKLLSSELLTRCADEIEAARRDLADERRITDGLGEALRRFYEDDDAFGVDEILEQWDEARGID